MIDTCGGVYIAWGLTAGFFLVSLSLALYAHFRSRRFLRSVLSVGMRGADGAPGRDGGGGGGGGGYGGRGGDGGSVVCKAPVVTYGAGRRPS